MKPYLFLVLCLFAGAVRAEPPAIKTVKRSQKAEDPSEMLEVPDVADPGGKASKASPPKPPLKLLPKDSMAAPAKKAATLTAFGPPPAESAPPKAAAYSFGVIPDKNLTAPINTEISVILSDNKFFPSKFKVREGLPTKIFFTTVNRRPGALVIEQLSIQRWIAKDHPPGEAVERSKWETNKEIIENRITEIVLEPKPGSYKFHDALSGASGEIIVE